MKNKGTVLAGLILSLGTIFSSCQISNSTQYAATYSDGQIPTGVYVLYSLQEASGKVFEEISQTDPELYMQIRNDNEIIDSTNFNGKLIEDLIVERAKTEMQMHVGANKLFEELKLNLTDEQKEFLKQAEGYYEENEDNFKVQGISKESYISYAENIQKRQVLFDYYYGENGKNRPKDEELKKYFADNYLKLSIRPFRYGTDENKEKSKEEAQKFLDSVKDNGFEETWSEAKAKALEEERKAKEEEAAKKQAEKTAEGNKVEEAEKSDESAEAESSEADADEKSEKNTEKEETPEEARNRIKNLNTNIVEKLRLKSVFKQKELDKIDNTNVGMPILADSVSNKAFFVIVKQQTDEQDFENIKEEVLHESCERPFEKLLVAKGESTNIKFNETAISEFRPSKVQKKKNN